MSDEFDKEAEREKLREKFEQDEEKRQETQRMSELLLQGATMTNEHCENCGDPLFRDGGQTFCPTCAGAQAGEAAGESTEQPQQQQTQQQAQREVQQQPPQQAQPATETQPRQSETATRSNGTEPTPQEQVDAAVGGQSARTQRAPESTATAAAGPRAELQRAVTTTARKASEATDPRTAKEWLEASKEAAEALAALEQ